MKTVILGPLGEDALRLMLRGPLTFRTLAATLAPGRSRPTDKPRDERGARTALATLARRGWAVRDGEGYSITPAGRAKLDEQVADDERIPPEAVLPATHRRCWKCQRARPLDAFHGDRSKADGLSTRCRRCNVEAQSEVRAARRLSQNAETSIMWTRVGKNVLVLRALRLIEAARAARHAGLWHGREGLKAYRDLGEALDAFTNDADPTLDPAEVTPRERSIEPADPSDAEWNKREHTTPRHIREHFEAAP